MKPYQDHDPIKDRGKAFPHPKRHTARSMHIPTAAKLSGKKLLAAFMRMLAMRPTKH